MGIKEEENLAVVDLVFWSMFWWDQKLFMNKSEYFIQYQLNWAFAMFGYECCFNQ